MTRMSTTANLPAASRPAARRGRPGYERADILRIAVASFIEHGYDATSMAILGERLGLSKSAIYHHVPSKDELLRVALDEALGSLEAVLHEARALDVRSDERLEFFIRGAVRALIENLPTVTLLLRVRGNSETERAALARRRDFDRATTDLMIQARDDGYLRPDIDPRLATRLVFGMVNSIVEWYKPSDARNADAIADATITIALRGLSDER